MKQYSIPIFACDNVKIVATNSNGTITAIGCEVEKKEIVPSIQQNHKRNVVLSPTGGVIFDTCHSLQWIKLLMTK